MFVLFTGCEKPLESTTRGRLALGTLVEVTVVSRDVQPHEGWIDDAFAEIARIEHIATIHDSSSELSRLNAKAPLERVTPNNELRGLIQRSVALGRLTGGAFDITLKPLYDLWRSAEVSGMPPDQDAITETLQRVGIWRLTLDTVDGSVSLPSGGGIDLGAIAKGYAVDRALSVLKKSGAAGRMVNAGGDLAVFWSAPGRDHWAVGIRHPRGGAGETFAVLKLRNGAVATSGDYERGFSFGDTTYTHILNPRTGRPASGIISATVVSVTAEMADALATAVFVAGADTGIDLLNRIPGITGLVVVQTPEGELSAIASEGFLKVATVDAAQIPLRQQ